MSSREELTIKKAVDRMLALNRELQREPIPIEVLKLSIEIERNLMLREIANALRRGEKMEALDLGDFAGGGTTTPVFTAAPPQMNPIEAKVMNLPKQGK